MVAQDPGSWTDFLFATELTIAWSRTDVLIDDEGGRVVGFAVYWRVADELQLLNLAVESGMRRRGLGGLLLAQLGEVARENGQVRITLEVRQSNVAALSLYRRHGFVETAVRKGYYRSTGEDAILMAKEVAPELMR